MQSKPKAFGAHNLLWEPNFRWPLSPLERMALHSAAHRFSKGMVVQAGLDLHVSHGNRVISPLAMKESVAITLQNCIHRNYEHIKLL